MTRAISSFFGSGSTANQNRAEASGNRELTITFFLRQHAVADEIADLIILDIPH
jgi:hypothetical protein